MEMEQRAMCGTDCTACKWKEQTGCPGCRQSKSKMFWGECDKAKCCLDKGLEHCGGCPELPCQKLLDLFADPEHGDSGVRLRNLKSWAGENGR